MRVFPHSILDNPRRRPSWGASSAPLRVVRDLLEYRQTAMLPPITVIGNMTTPWVGLFVWGLVGHLGKDE